MLNDNDIQKYLAMINKSESEHQNVQSKVGSNKSISMNKISIDPTCGIRGIERIIFGNNVVIQKKGSNIGKRCTVSAANRICIGKFVLIAPNAFIADTHHAYQKIEVPIMHQGITTHNDQVTIEDESWIGINAVIMGNVRIGKHCVIEANSVITKNVPDYCVAVGNPAKVVKMLDTKTG